MSLEGASQGSLHASKCNRTAQNLPMSTVPMLPVLQYSFRAAYEGVVSNLSAEPQGRDAALFAEYDVAEHRSRPSPSNLHDP